MNYLPNHGEWPGPERLSEEQLAYEQFTNDLPQLTDEERAALDEMPQDAVAHWWRGEKWDFDKKEWVAADSQQRRC